MTQPSRMATIVACACLLLACTRQTPAPLRSGEPEPPLHEGWKAIEIDRVSFHAPSDLVDKNPIGEDSVVGQWERPSMRVELDFGWYSDNSFLGRFDGKTMKDGTLEHVVVDGRPARLATWSDEDQESGFLHCSALYVPDVDGTGEAVGEVKLDFRVVHRDAKDTELARRILLSARIAAPPR